MARPPFVADIVALRRHPGHREHLSVRAPLSGLEVTASRVASEVVAEVDLEAVEGGIVVDGTVSASWAGECRRCLGTVSGDVSATVSEVFVSDPEEGVTYPIHGDHIDLEPMVREAVVLALPLAPLCAATCRGLCPRCGADLNAGPCGCPQDDPDPRWAGLDALRREP